MHRRSLLGSLSLILAAPVIVRAGSLMPIFVPRLTLDDLYDLAVSRGADLVVANEAGTAKAYVVHPGVHPYGMVLDRHNTIAIGQFSPVGWPTAAGKNSHSFISRYTTHMPHVTSAFIRPSVFDRMQGQWTWRTV